MDFSNELDFAINLAKEAGKLIMKHAHSKVVINYKKNEWDPVTEADIEADNYIISEIKKAFPNDGILTEESKNDPTRLKKERVWIIDPIDGTANFKMYALSDCKDQDCRFFAVQIGLAIKSKPNLGVLYVPATDELYYASKNLGSYSIINNVKARLKINDEKLDKNKVSLRDTILESEWGKKEFPNLLPIRPFGKVFGYNVAAIADGRIDAYISDYDGFGEWDFCAPQIILEEAGGSMTHLDGKQIRYNNENPLQPNGILAEKKKGLIKIN